MSQAETNDERPRSSQRQVMQRLRTDVWRSFAKLGVSMGASGLERLVVNGWVEGRGEGQMLELRLTAAGLDALKAKIPDEPPPIWAKRRKRTGE